VRILITGGAGFIGSNLARAMVRDGHQVVLFDNLATMQSTRLIDDLLDHAEFIHGDIRCPEDLDRLPAGGWDVVFHLAASFANELSVEYPALDARTNVDGTVNVLGVSERQGCGLFVYAGSSSSYGDGAVPFREEQIPRPLTPYATSKHMGETYVMSSRLDHAVFRFFNVYGPGDPPGRYRNAIPNMFKALDTAGSIRVFGRDATRDFTYVDDVVSFLREATRARGQVVNVGTGRETAIVDLARRMLRLQRVASDRLSIEPLRQWDRVSRRCADVTRLEELFGRLPTMPLDDGLLRTARWLSENGFISRRAQGLDEAA
jgi:nucleoside-diphosphate-sugar epimerase